jgi:predicted AAA+ superfamily ATPase
MRRKISDRLEQWRQKTDALPLVVFGARQVGKTFSVKEFGAERFPKMAYANFQHDLTRVSHDFEGTLDPARIVEDLSLLLDVRITPGDTLVILDEIQLCQPALTALKYFAEDAPQYRILATGSQFGISFHRDPRYSFPVGKIELAAMYPMDFEEYLWAVGKEGWATAIRECFAEDRGFIAHDDALRLYQRYLLSGGMPAVVAEYGRSGDWSAVREIQADISRLYVADMNIYLDKTEAARCQAVWESAPAQLARDQSKKFKLADVGSNAKARQFEAPFVWLDSAGIIYRHRLVEHAVAPLEPKEGTFFKVYLHDVGLLSRAMGVTPQVFLTRPEELARGFRGGLAENYVKQALQANGVTSYYWRSGNTAEVDFILTDDALNVVPLEAKSGGDSRSKSLAVYRQRYAPKLSLRLSTKGFGSAGGIKSVPLYAAYCITSANVSPLPDR